MDNLPEILVHTLVDISSSQKLAQWNVTSNGGVINVSMRFVKEGHIDTHSPMSTGGRKNLSRLQRDTERHHAFTAAQMNSPFQPATYNIRRKMSFDENCEIENQPSVTGMVTSSTGVPINSSPSDQVSEPKHDTDSDMGQSSEVNINSKQTPSIQSNQLFESQSNDNQLAKQSCKTVMTVSNEPQEDEASAQYDPSQYFMKVVADFRMSVDNTLVRGLTPNGAIVSLNTGKSENNLEILYRIIDTYVQYDEIYGWINSFFDQRYSSTWTKSVQALCAGWKQYCDTIT